MRYEAVVQIPVEVIVKKFFEEHKEAKRLDYSALNRISSLLTHTYRNMHVSFDLSGKELERIAAESDGVLVIGKQGIVRQKKRAYATQKQITGSMREFAEEKLYAALKNYAP